MVEEKRRKEKGPPLWAIGRAAEGMKRAEAEAKEESKKPSPTKPAEKKEVKKKSFVGSFLDIFKKKCPKCGSTNIVKEYETDAKIVYGCLDCRGVWTENKKTKKIVSAEEPGEGKKDGKEGGRLSKLTKRQAEVTGFLATRIGRILSGLFYMGVLLVIFAGFITGYVVNFVVKTFGLEKLFQSTLIAVIYPIAPGLVPYIPAIPAIFGGLILLMIALFGFFVMPRLSLGKNAAILVIAAVGVLSFPMLMSAASNIPVALGGTAGEGLASLMCMITSPEDVEGCMKERGFGMQVTKVGGYEAITIKFGTEATDYELTPAYGDSATGEIFPYFFAVSIENPDEEKIVHGLNLSATILNGTEVLIPKLEPDLCTTTVPCTLMPGEKTTVTFDTADEWGEGIKDKSKELSIQLSVSYKFFGEGKNTYMFYQEPEGAKGGLTPISTSGPLDVAVYFVPEVYIVETYEGKRDYVDVYFSLIKETGYSALPDTIEVEKINITRSTEGLPRTFLTPRTEEDGKECHGPFGGLNFIRWDPTAEGSQTNELILTTKDKKPISKDRTYRCSYTIGLGGMDIPDYKSVPFSVVVDYVHKKTIETTIKVERL